MKNERQLERLGTIKLDLRINREASQLLRNLILRPNPRQAEFNFIGLSHNKVIDHILVANKKYYSKASGFDPKQGASHSDSNELPILGMKLQKFVSDEEVDGLVMGHSHPTRKFLYFDTVIWLDDEDSLLNPSPKDIKVAKMFSRGVPSDASYMGIVAETKRGPRLRIFKVSELARIKNLEDIYSVPQITLKI